MLVNVASADKEFLMLLLNAYSRTFPGVSVK